MVRTVIAIDDDIKSWVDIKAKQEGVSMTELVRRALQLLKEQDALRFDAELAKTSGIWTGGDGLEFQKKERESW
jgi:hypothetical protein